MDENLENQIRQQIETSKNKYRDFKPLILKLSPTEKKVLRKAAKTFQNCRKIEIPEHIIKKLCATNLDCFKILCDVAILTKDKRMM